MEKYIKLLQIENNSFSKPDSEHFSLSTEKISGTLQFDVSINDKV